MATGEENNQTDMTERLIALTKENEELRTKIAAFEDANKTNAEALAKKDGEISRLNKLLVDHVLTGKDPNGTGSESGDKSPMDIYAETLREMKKVKS